MCWKIDCLIPEKLKPHKISWKIAITYAALFSAVLIVLNAGTLFGIRFYLIRQAKNQVDISSRNTLNAIASVSAGKSDDLARPEELDETRSNPEISIRITDLTGKVMNSSGEGPSDNLKSGLPMGKIILVEVKDRHFVLENSKIPAKSGGLAGYLQVCYNMRSEYRFIKLLFVFMAFSDFLGLLISIFVGRIISAHTLKPIDSMTKTAREISSGDLKNRVEVGSADDELTRLAVTFNQMIEKLQISFEKQTRFVSDASHELRTPIAVVQGYADMIERWGKDDPDVLKEAISAIHKETKDMGDLVEKLLFLARGDSNKIRLKKTDFDLEPLLCEITAESRLIAPRHHFAYRMREPVRLHADRKLVKQALRALIENSVKYTPENGSIRIGAGFQDGRTVIEVCDTGIGIAPEEQPKLFDRFYRVDKGRSKEKGGSGLGLSIVKWIVEAHAGTIRVKSRPRKGTAVIIQLPGASNGKISARGGNP